MLLSKLPDLDLNSYYRPLEEDSYDIVLKEAGFNYGKELSPEERINLHGKNPQKSLKGKGAGKNKKVAFDSGEGGSGETERFYLKGVDLKVRKVRFVLFHCFIS